MEFIKGWVINISCAVFFIIAIEMILPDNKMKKYSKFVLGLILMTVFINPIVMLINKGQSIIPTWQYNIEKYSEELFGTSNQDVSVYSNSYIDNTLRTFENNIKNICEEKLKIKYPNYYYSVSVKAEFIEKEKKYDIEYINIEVSNSIVSKVKKIEINTKNSVNTDVQNKESDELTYQFKSFLSSELQIGQEKIKVYSK